MKNREKAAEKWPKMEQPSWENQCTTSCNDDSDKLTSSSDTPIGCELPLNCRSSLHLHTIAVDSDEEIWLVPQPTNPFYSFDSPRQQVSGVGI
jgi:hypothetical protein